MTADHQERRRIISFAAVETLLLILVKYYDFVRRFSLSGILEYTGIVLCLAYVLFCFFKAGGREDSFRETYLIPLAMGLTAAADFFLVLLNRFYLAGVTLFCLVQTVYGIYVTGILAEQHAKTHERSRQIVRRALICLLALGVVLTAAGFSWLVALSTYSMVMLTMNMLDAWIICRRDRGTFRSLKRHVFAWGITLFFLCDLCVGLYNAHAYLDFIPPWFTQGVYPLIWLFYLPGQTLIAISYSLQKAPKRRTEE